MKPRKNPSLNLPTNMWKRDPTETICVFITKRVARRIHVTGMNIMCSMDANTNIGLKLTKLLRTNLT